MPQRKWNVIASILSVFAVVASSGMPCAMAGEDQPERFFRVLNRFKAAEAYQGVAVDKQHFYAVTNRAIGKYEKRTGKLIVRWKAPTDSPLRHLNSGVVIEGKLYCAQSNWPALPLKNSIEIWDTATMKHVGRREFERMDGALTWVDRHNDHWWIVFAYYGKEENVRRTTLMQLDDQWRQKASWRFPNQVLKRFLPFSNSGGSWGPKGLLYVTGHDLAEMYALRLPPGGKTLELVDIVPAGIEGQGIAWDRSENGVVYGIRRKTKEVIKSRLAQTSE